MGERGYVDLIDLVGHFKNKAHVCPCSCWLFWEDRPCPASHSWAKIWVTGPKWSILRKSSESKSPWSSHGGQSDKWQSRWTARPLMFSIQSLEEEPPSLLLCYLLRPKAGLLIEAMQVTDSKGTRPQLGRRKQGACHSKRGCYLHKARSLPLALGLVLRGWHSGESCPVGICRCVLSSPFLSASLRCSNSE